MQYGTLNTNTKGQEYKAGKETGNEKMEEGRWKSGNWNIPQERYKKLNMNPYENCRNECRKRTRTGSMTEVDTSKLKRIEKNVAEKRV